MHPIERLRFVARSQGAPAELLVQESAVALGAFRDDPAGMVAACRRIVDRQLTCAPLWWLCARMLCSDDPMVEARTAVHAICDDPTARHLAAALPDDGCVVIVGEPDLVAASVARRGDVRVVVVDVDGEAADCARRLGDVDVDAHPVASRSVAAAVDRADLVLFEAFAVGPDSALVPAGSRAAAALARHAGVPVWIVAGVGRLMPARMWGALVDRWSASVDPLDAPEEELRLDLVDRVVGPAGPEVVAEALRRTDCPVAPELFRLAG